MWRVVLAGVISGSGSLRCVICHLRTRMSYVGSGLFNKSNTFLGSKICWVRIKMIQCLL